MLVFVKMRFKTCYLKRLWHTRTGVDVKYTPWVRRKITNDYIIHSKCYRGCTNARFTGRWLANGSEPTNKRRWLKGVILSLHRIAAVFFQRGYSSKLHHSVEFVRPPLVRNVLLRPLTIGWR